MEKRGFPTRAEPELRRVVGRGGGSWGEERSIPLQTPPPGAKMQEEFLRWPKSFGKCKHNALRPGQPVQAPGGESRGLSPGLRVSDFPPCVPARRLPAGRGWTVGVPK